MKYFLIILISLIIFISCKCSNKRELDINKNTDLSNNIEKINDTEITNDINNKINYNEYIGIYIYDSVENIIGTYKIYDEERIMEDKNFNVQWVLPKTKDMYIEIKQNKNGELVMELHIDYYVIPKKNIFEIDFPLYNDNRILGYASQNETDCYYYFGDKIIREYEVWNGDKFRMIFLKK